MDEHAEALPGAAPRSFAGRLACCDNTAVEEEQDSGTVGSMGVTACL